MNDNFSQNIIKQIDKGVSILDIAEYFGGLDNFRKIVLKYPYLVGLVETKLGGYISIDVVVEEYETYEIPFTLIGMEPVDDIEDHYNVSINLEIPEITNKEDLEKLFYWIDEYCGDRGSDIASFNDRKLNLMSIWVYPGEINGKSWKDFTTKYGGVLANDEEIKKIIPNEYKI